MNAYLAHAAATPAPSRGMQKALSPLDLKMAEKQRLSRAYRRWRRQHIREVLTTEPRLLALRRYLRAAGDGDEIVSAIAKSWLPASQQDVRILALQMVDARCNRLNREAGFEALDDPLPPETSVYFRARDILHAGGRA